MSQHNKNLLFSSFSLILGLVILLNPFPWIENGLTDKFDGFMFELTNYTWMWASTDINFAISLAVPLLLLLLSIYFAVKSLKTDLAQTKNQRITSIGLITFTTGLLVVMVGVNLYLFLL